MPHTEIHPSPIPYEGDRPRPLAVSIADFRSLIPVSRTKCHELMATGQLKTILVGRRRLILMDSVAAFIALNTVSGESND